MSAGSPARRTTSPPAPGPRNTILRIPNAKASRLRPGQDGSPSEWSFLALGDFVVYQVNLASPSASASSPSPSSSRRAASAPSPGAADLNSASPSSSSSSSSSGIILAVRNMEFPLAPASTAVTFEPPNSYILDNASGYVVKVELEMPRNGSHEILDNVLRRYTTNRLASPSDSPSGYATPTSQMSTTSSSSSSPELLPSDFRGQLILMDESTGKMLGPLSAESGGDASGATGVGSRSRIKENADVATSGNAAAAGSYGAGQGAPAVQTPLEEAAENPVYVTFGSDDPNSTLQPGEIEVKSAFQDLTSQYGKSDSRIVAAAEYVSKGILFAAEYGANSVSGAAKNYTATTKATDTPLVFSDTTKKGVAMVAGATGTAAKFSRRAIGFIGSKAEQLGSTASNKLSEGTKAMGLSEGEKPGADPNSGWRGYLRQGVQAINTVADGVERGAKHFVETGRESTNAVVQHRFGEDAKDLTNSITSVGSNVIIVYVDARGALHRALLKRAGKGALKARMKDGREVILDDSGMEDQHTERDKDGNLLVIDEKNKESYNFGSDGGGPPAGPSATAAAPPAYTSAIDSARTGNSTNRLSHRAPPPPVPPRP